MMVYSIMSDVEIVAIDGASNNGWLRGARAGRLKWSGGMVPYDVQL